MNVDSQRILLIYINQMHKDRWYLNGLYPVRKWYLGISILGGGILHNKTVKCHIILYTVNIQTQTNIEETEKPVIGTLTYYQNKLGF